MLKFSDLTPEEITKVSDGCGIVAKGLGVPNFIFKARCDQHDVYWCRGTGWSWNETVLRYGPIGWLLMPYSVLRWYVQGVYFLVQANFLFYIWMLWDAIQHWREPLKAFIYIVIATMYFIAVMPIALIPRTSAMTRWRSKEETIAYAQANKLFK